MITAQLLCLNSVSLAVKLHCGFCFVLVVVIMIVLELFNGNICDPIYENQPNSAKFNFWL